jgi:Actin
MMSLPIGQFPSHLNSSSVFFFSCTSHPAPVSDALWAQTDSLTTGYGVAGSLAPPSTSTSTGSAYASASASTSSSLNVAVVVDNGSGLLKAGMAGDSLPRAVIPSIVGRAHATSHKVMDSKTASSSTYVGEAAQAHRGILELSHPVTQGVVVDWVWCSCIVFVWCVF